VARRRVRRRSSNDRRRARGEGGLGGDGLGRALLEGVCRAVTSGRSLTQVPALVVRVRVAPAKRRASLITRSCGRPHATRTRGAAPVRGGGQSARGGEDRDAPGRAGSGARASRGRRSSAAVDAGEDDDRATTTTGSSGGLDGWQGSMRSRWQSGTGRAWRLAQLEGARERREERRRLNVGLVHLVSPRLGLVRLD